MPPDTNPTDHRTSQQEVSSKGNQEVESTLNVLRQYLIECPPESRTQFINWVQSLKSGKDMSRQIEAGIQGGKLYFHQKAAATT